MCGTVNAVCVSAASKWGAAKSDVCENWSNPILCLLLVLLVVLVYHVYGRFRDDHIIFERVDFHSHASDQFEHTC